LKVENQLSAICCKPPFPDPQNALGIEAASFASCILERERDLERGRNKANKDIAESPTAQPERPIN